METLDLATATWLITDAAQQHVRAATAAADAHVPVLKIAEQIQRTSTLSASRRQAVLQLAMLRIKARSRYTNADDMLFTADALEQMSQPDVARWRASALLARSQTSTASAPRRIVDLCAGVGGDAEYLAQLGHPLTCVEHDPIRALFLRHNLSVLCLDATVAVSDAKTFNTSTTDAVHADPARRHNGRRITALSAYRPSVPVLLQNHAAAQVVAIAVAPGVDRNDPALPNNTPVTYLDVAGQLTEAVLWGGQTQATATTVATAVILPEQLVLHRQGEPERVPVADTFGQWLVTVRPAAVRARVHDMIADALGAKRVANHRALFHVDTEPPASPWYQARHIVAVSSAQPKQIRATVATLEKRPIELVLHGVDTDVTQLWQRLGSPPRGPTGWRVELIRRDTDTVTVITDASP